MLDIDTNAKPIFQGGVTFIKAGTITSFFIMLIIPSTAPIFFAILGGYSLRMSDDYAAITAGAIVALILLAVVEMHVALGKTRDAFIAVSTAQQNGDQDAEKEALFRRKDLANRTFIWSISLSMLAVALVLTALWAAISDHGPARWLAWFSWVSICFGVGHLLASAFHLFSDGFMEISKLYGRIESNEASGNIDTGSQV
ncbi:hypothetical protein ACWLMY_37665 [Streptomyces anulatus]